MNYVERLQDQKNILIEPELSENRTVSAVCLPFSKICFYFKKNIQIIGVMVAIFEKKIGSKYLKTYSIFDDLYEMKCRCKKIECLL